MGVFKKSLSPTRRDAVDPPRERELIQEARTARRASVERATGSPPGALEDEGVRRGGVEDARASAIASSVSGVPARGVGRVLAAAYRRAAGVLGRVPSSRDLGGPKGPPKGRIRR